MFDGKVPFVAEVGALAEPRVGAHEELVGDDGQLRRDRVRRRVPVLDVAPVHQRVDGLPGHDVDVVLEVRKILWRSGARALEGMTVLVDDAFVTPVRVEGVVAASRVEVADDRRERVAGRVVRLDVHEGAVGLARQPRGVVGRQGVGHAAAVDEVVARVVGAPVDGLRALDGQVHLGVDLREEEDVLVLWVEGRVGAGVDLPGRPGGAHDERSVEAHLLLLRHVGAARVEVRPGRAGREGVRHGAARRHRPAGPSR